MKAARPICLWQKYPLILLVLVFPEAAFFAASLLAPSTTSQTAKVLAGDR